VKHVILEAIPLIRPDLIGFARPPIAIRRPAITRRDHDIAVNRRSVGLFVLFDLANRSDRDDIVTEPGWTSPRTPVTRLGAAESPWHRPDARSDRRDVGEPGTHRIRPQRIHGRDGPLG
jgi:hypothetical protein